MITKKLVILPNLSQYSSVRNRHACTFISGKICLLSSIDVRRQTLPEKNVHARLFGTLEYLGSKSKHKVKNCLVTTKKYQHQCSLALIRL